MTNLEIITAITENLRKALEGLGASFSEKIHEDATPIPASLLPLGEIFYIGEGFEYTHGQRPGYAEAEFTLKVTFSNHNHGEALDSAQSWLHGIRRVLTVNVLNDGALSIEKSVSRVEIKGAEIGTEHGLGSLRCRANVRYREASV